MCSRFVPWKGRRQEKQRKVVEMVGRGRKEKKRRKGKAGGKGKYKIKGRRKTVSPYVFFSPRKGQESNPGKASRGQIVCYSSFFLKQFLRPRCQGLRGGYRANHRGCLAPKVLITSPHPGVFLTSHGALLRGCYNPFRLPDPNFNQPPPPAVF